jgi:hypothetical protein
MSIQTYLGVEVVSGNVSKVNHVYLWSEKIFHFFILILFEDKILGPPLVISKL